MVWGPNPRKEKSEKPFDWIAQSGRIRLTMGLSDELLSAKDLFGPLTSNTISDIRSGSEGWAPLHLTSVFYIFIYKNYNT